MTRRLTLADPGRRRRLERLTGTGSVVTGLALDLGEALRTALEGRGLPPPTPLQARRLGTELAQALAGLASLVKLDEECGGEAIRAGAVPPHVALTMPLAAEGEVETAGGDATLTPDPFSPQRALWWGADACHLAIADLPAGFESATAWDELVAGAVAACHASGVPLIVEPIVARTQGETPTAFAAAVRARTLASAARLAALGPDLLAVRVPVPSPAGRAGEPAALAAASAAIDEACGIVPWVVVDSGTDAGRFEEQIRAAGSAGASGFIAGRAVWQSALVLDSGERRRAIETAGVPTFTRFVEAAWTSCHPLTERPTVREPHRHQPVRTAPAARADGRADGRRAGRAGHRQ